MRCIDCVNADLQSGPKMARHGFCECKAVRIIGHSHSLVFERVCANYAQAPPETKKKRLDWLTVQQKNI